jgi:hypothetical protein
MRHKTAFPATNPPTASEAALTRRSRWVLKCYFAPKHGPLTVRNPLGYPTHPSLWSYEKVSTAASVIRSLETYEWDAQIYGTLSIVSRLAVGVRNKANVLRIAYSLHKVNRSLQALLDKVHGAMEGKTSAKADEPTSESRLRQTADNLTRMHHTIEYVYESLRRVGMTNNSLTASTLRTLRAHGESVLDLADWFETISQSEEVKAIFERSREEKNKGDVYEINQVQ